MFNKILSLIICFEIMTMSPTARGQVKYLSEGTPAPYSGYLFSPDKELDVRTKVLDRERLMELTKKQDELIGTLNQRIEVQNQMSENLRSELKFEESKSFWAKIIYFGLGVVATGLVVYSAKQVN